MISYRQGAWKNVQEIDKFVFNTFNFSASYGHVSKYVCPSPLAIELIRILLDQTRMDNEQYW